MIKTIFWNIKNGDDKRNGLSPKEAVKTQDRINELLERDFDIKQSKTGHITQYPGKDFKIGSFE